MAKTVSFDAPVSPWDVQRKALEDERRRLAAEQMALMQRPLEGKMVSNHYIAPSWTQGLAKAVGSYLNKRGRGKVAEKEEGVRQEEQRTLVEDVQKFLDAMSPKPGTPARTEMVQGKMVDPPEYWKPEPAQTFGLEQGQAAPNPPRKVEMEGVAQPTEVPAELSTEMLKEIGSNLQREPQFAGALPGTGMSKPPFFRPTNPPMQVGTLPQGPAPASIAPKMPPFASAPPMTSREIPGTPDQPANPRQALMAALSSRHPMMQQIGAQLLMQQTGAGGGAEPLSMQDFLKASQYLDPATLTAIGAPENFKQLGMRNNFMTVPQGAAVMPKTGEAQLLPTTQGRFGAPFQRGKDWYQKDEATGMEKKLDNAPQISMSMQPEPTYLRERAQALAGDVTTAQRAAASARGMLVNLDYLDNLNKQTQTAGPLAEFGMLVSGLGNMVGFPVDQDRLATDETYRSVVNRQIVDTFMNAVGGAHGFTEMETKMLAQSYPQINMNKKARETVIGIMRAKMQRDIAASEQALQQESANFPELGKIPKVTGAVPTQPAGTDMSPWSEDDEAELQRLLNKSKGQ